MAAFFHLLIRLLQRVILFIWYKLVPDRKVTFPPLNPLLKLSVQELVSGIKNGQIKSQDLIEAAFDRIAKVNPAINAVVDQRYKEALEEAQQVDQLVKRHLKGEDGLDHLLEKPLLGIPVTIKDTLAVQGMLQTAGVFCRAKTQAEFDSSVVAQLKRKGAIPIAITNVPEILMAWETTNLPFGTTRNPYDLSRISGGSSGGEGAILAAGASVFGVGTDIGGSIRIPSFMCGVYGHRPTPFLIETNGRWPPPTPEADAFSTIGPMTRHVEDLKYCLHSMVNPEKLPQLDLERPVKIEELKIFWLDEFNGPFISPLHEDVKYSIQHSIDHFERKFGLTCQSLKLPHTEKAFSLWRASIYERGKLNVSRGLARASGKRAISPMLEFVKSTIGLSDHTMVGLSAAIAMDWLHASDDTQLATMCKYVDEMRHIAIQQLSSNGVIIAPTMPQPAPKIGSTAVTFADIVYTSLFNTLGFPSTHVPTKLTRQGLPVGIQVASTPMNDRLCLAVAQELDQLFKFKLCT